MEIFLTSEMMWWQIKHGSINHIESFKSLHNDFQSSQKLVGMLGL